MKRGLIALFVVGVLMLNVIGVSAIGQISGDVNSMNNGTANAVSASIIVPNQNSNIEIEIVSPWERIWDTALLVTSPTFYSLIKRFGGFDVQSTSAASVRG